MQKLDEKVKVKGTQPPPQGEPSPPAGATNIDPRPDRPEVDVEGLHRELKLALGEQAEVRFDRGSRALYATDGSNYRQVPLGVVVPKTVDAAEQAIALCRQFGAPVVNRGGGTALAGQTCNVAVVLDFSKYLYRVLEIDPRTKRARVQPGCILDNLRNLAQEQHKLTFGPDPATHNHCTLGGMIGNNSCGIHSVMAGRTADNVHELEVLTYDGCRLRVGPTSESELASIIAAGGRRGEIYRRLRDLRDRYGDLIRQRYPKIPRRVSGYNLDELLPEKGFNVARALVGSESTCVTLLEATVQLIDFPPGRALLVLGYPDVYSAGDHVPQIMAHKPIGLEGLDHMLVEFMKRKKLHPHDVQMLPDGGGWLLVEFGADTRKEAAERARQVMDELRKLKNPPNMKLFDNEHDEAHIWEVRESGLGATAHVPGVPSAWPGWEDSAVPPDRVGEYLRELRGLMEKYDYQASLYGHFGQGCIHCRITFDLRSQAGIEKYLKFINEAGDMIVRYGGSMSGEHGDGQSRAMLLPKMYGPELIEAFRQFKRIWDPDWKMNPGKVVDAHRPDQNLRLGAHYRPWKPPTYYKFPDDAGSFAEATLRCVGVGKCRRTHDAFMCPSFLATREEKDTTRGRAHLLFEMFQRDVIDSDWASTEVLESLELCLACKGCKKDCPVSVDLATYKSEFLAQHYEGHLRPRNHYSMGWIGHWAWLGGLLPSVSNFFGQVPPFSIVGKFLAGISQRRRLPAFRKPNFMKWHRRNRPAPTAGVEVMLYPDTFNDYFYPQTLIAAVKALEAFGFSVRVPPRRPHCIRPLLHYGWLARAIPKIRQTIDMLGPQIDRGTPIVFAEPSTAAVFREELRSLMPDDERAGKLAGQCYLLSEFLMARDVKLPRLDGGKVVLHNHCHQKAVLDPDALRTMIGRMGLGIIEPQPGCCGMAGSFGFEAQHYDVSMKIANEHLLPTVHQADADTLIVADGFSCRTQIIDGSGREPMHSSELLLHALRKAGRIKDDA